MKVTLYTDGGSRGNPGPAGIGVYAFEKESQKEWRYGEFIGDTTNNEAEYRALCRGLEQCLDKGVQELEIYMDSELIVKQIRGIYRVKSEGLLPYYEKAKEMMSRFRIVSITHVPRAKNKVADSLVNRALDERGRVEEGELFSAPDMVKEESFYESRSCPGYEVEPSGMSKEARVEEAEKRLGRFLSFPFELEKRGGSLCIRGSAEDFSVLLRERIQIISEMKEAGFHEVVLDLRAYGE